MSKHMKALICDLKLKPWKAVANSHSNQGLRATKEKKEESCCLRVLTCNPESLGHNLKTSLSPFQACVSECQVRAALKYHQKVGG